MVDILSRVPDERRQTVLGNAARLAAEGIVIVDTWCSSSAEGTSIEHEAGTLLRKAGFQRDLDLESWLRPFVADPATRAGVRVFTRYHLSLGLEPQACDLSVDHELSHQRCVLGISFGCVNDEAIWVNDGCAAWFRRAGARTICSSYVGPAAVRSDWVRSNKWWRYVECTLPEGKASVHEQCGEGFTGEPATLCGIYRDVPLPFTQLPFTQAGGLNAFVSDEFGLVSGSEGFMPLLQVRLACPAFMEARVVEDGDGFKWGVAFPPGVCFSVNMWFTVGRAFRIAVLQAPRAGLGIPAAVGTPPTLPSSLLYADGLARRLHGDGGIFLLYDMLDPPTHSWGTDGQIWRAVAWGGDPPQVMSDRSSRGAHEAAQGRIESLAALVGLVRQVASVLTAGIGGREQLSGCGFIDAQIVVPGQEPAHAPEPAQPHLAGVLDRAMADLAAQLRGKQQELRCDLSQLGLVPSDAESCSHRMFNATPVSLVRARLPPEPDVQGGHYDPAGDHVWRLRCAPTPLGRYLYHKATYAD